MKIDLQISLASTRTGLAVSGGSSSSRALGGGGQNVSFDSIVKSFQDQPGLSSLERMEVVIQAELRSLCGKNESKADALNDMCAIIQTLGVNDENIRNVGAAWLSKMNSSDT